MAYSNEAVTVDQDQFQVECEAPFNERFSEADKDFIRVKNAGVGQPPVVQPKSGTTAMASKENYVDGDTCGGCTSSDEAIDHNPQLDTNKENSSLEDPQPLYGFLLSINVFGVYKVEPGKSVKLILSQNQTFFLQIAKINEQYVVPNNGLGWKEKTEQRRKEVSQREFDKLIFMHKGGVLQRDDTRKVRNIDM